MEQTKKKLVVGFDGFVDTICRPLIKTATHDTAPAYYPDIASLGIALQAQAGKSASIQLEVQTKRLGGNAPLLSRGAMTLGMDVCCIGMLGQPEPDPVFTRALSGSLFTFAPPGESTALEFSDGKIFLAPGVQLQAPAWQLIEKATHGKAAALLQQADGVAIVNWSELAFSQQLWADVYTHAFAPTACDKSRTILFDLCDCSRKSTDEIRAVLQLIGQYSTRRTTLLSLNENEAEVLLRQMLQQPPAETGAALMQLRAQFGIDEILLHARNENHYATSRGYTFLPGEVIEKPKISTGAGDHFNAALCYGAVHGFDDAKRLAFATRFVRAYLTGNEPFEHSP